MKRSEEARLAAASASAAANGPAPEVVKDGQLSTKLEGYIACLNRATASAFHAKRTYLTYIDAKKGPTGKENGVWISDLDPKSCVDDITKAKTLTPPLPEIETAAATYAASLTKLAAAIKPLEKYYEQKDFKDDNWAKGKELHAPLMATFEEFAAANKPFDDKVTALNAEISARRLARLEKDPSARLEYLIAKSVDDAKKLVNLADIKTLASLDGAAYGAALGNYEKTSQELEAYTTSHADEASKVTMLSRFSSESSSYLKSAKELMRRKRDDKDFAKESGSPESMDGHPANVVKQFNEVIEASNGLTFRS